MKALDRKVLRDLVHMRGQAVAIAAVIGAGVSLMIAAQMLVTSIEDSLLATYERLEFADVFATVKRAPASVLGQLERIPGVARVDGRLATDARIELETPTDSITGRLLSVGLDPDVGLNRVLVERGGWLTSSAGGQIIVSATFAASHDLDPGDAVIAIINGHRRRFQIVGIGMSADYVSQVPPGAVAPDSITFGVFWIGLDELAGTLDMRGSVNEVSATLTLGAHEPEVLLAFDDLLDRYGCLGAYGRDLHPSHSVMIEELRGMRSMGTLPPMLFLGVATFLLAFALGRLVDVQRTEIATLRAFGISRFAIARHFSLTALAIGLGGALLGSILGVRLADIMAATTKAFFRVPIEVFEIDFGLIATTIVIAMAASLAGAIPSVRRAAALEPAEGMRPPAPQSMGLTRFERLIGTQRLRMTTRMVIRGFEHRPIKSLLSACGIAAGVAMCLLGRFMSDSILTLMDHQFRLTDRSEVRVSFTEPRNLGALHELSALPGVLDADPVRTVSARLRWGHHLRRVSLRGLPADGLERLVDAELSDVPLAPGGIVLTDKLARVLQVRTGDVLRMEILSAERPTRAVTVTATFREYGGLAAYAELETFNGWLGEGPVLDGAHLLVDAHLIDSLQQELQDRPGIAATSVKRATIDSMMELLSQTVLQMQGLLFFFALIIAFGVVYNSSRVSLAERARELATLRVLGFRRGEVAGVLIAELALLTIVGVPIGLGLGPLLLLALEPGFDSETRRMPMVIEPDSIWIAIAIVIAASTFSALAVRRRVDQFDLVEVLKARDD